MSSSSSPNIFDFFGTADSTAPKNIPKESWQKFMDLTTSGTTTETIRSTKTMPVAKSKSKSSSPGGKKEKHEKKEKRCKKRKADRERSEKKVDRERSEKKADRERSEKKVDRERSEKKVDRERSEKKVDPEVKKTPSKPSPPYEPVFKFGEKTSSAPAFCFPSVPTASLPNRPAPARRNHSAPPFTFGGESVFAKTPTFDFRPPGEKYVTQFLESLEALEPILKSKIQEFEELLRRYPALQQIPAGPGEAPISLVQYLREKKWYDLLVVAVQYGRGSEEEIMDCCRLAKTAQGSHSYALMNAVVQFMTRKMKSQQNQIEQLEDDLVPWTYYKKEKVRKSYAKQIEEEAWGKKRRRK